MHSNARSAETRLSEVIQFSTTRRMRDELEEAARAQHRPLSSILREAAVAWLEDSPDGSNGASP